MEYEEFEKEIEKAFIEKINISLEKEKIKKLYIFMQMLIEKNKVMNLTAITDEKEIIFKHFVDSCMYIKDAVFNKIQRFEKLKYIDVGTGAGFPGLPIAIVLDDAKFVLMDSLNKRIKFISEVLEEIKMKNIFVIHSRVEDLAKDKEHREKYDFCISRAVAEMRILAEYTLPFCKVNGYTFFYKMKDSEEEMKNAKNALNILGGKKETKFDYKLYENDHERTIYNIKKIKETDFKYPRKAGFLQKSPL